MHAHFWMSGLAALSATRELDVPVVQTFHALGVAKRRFQGRSDTSPPVRIRMERALARDVDRVIATSTEEVAELLRIGAVPRPDRGRAVRRGRRASSARTGAVAERGDRPRLLCLGRLVPRKGFDTVIRALAAVPDAELVIGGGPAADELAGDPEAARLTPAGRAVRRGRPGPADRRRCRARTCRALLRSADLVVCTPWYEPFGIVPLEAMACGVPVVASAVGGFLDTVVDGATGALVPPRRPDRLAAAIRRLLAEPFWREAYGTAGVDRARSRYSWDRIAAGTLAVYEDVLGRGAAPVAAEDEDELETAAGSPA